MKAVSATRSLAETAVAAIVAGTDAVLLCNSTADEQVGALEALIRAAERHELTERRIDDAMSRQEHVKARFLGAARPGASVPVDVVGSAGHQAVARDMAAWL
jgi:beta-glucosidase-like glycosyl hydrolase